MTRRTIPISDGMTYESLRERFTWSIPERFNTGAACADVHPEGAPALITVCP